MNRVVRTWREFGVDHCSQMAAAIAYYVLFSIIPLITLMVAIFGALMRNPQNQQGAVDRVLQVLPLQAGSGQNALFDTIRNVSSQTGTLTLIGIIGLVWSSSGMFGAIRTALNVAWDVEDRHGFLREKLLDIFAVLALGMAMVVSLGATVAMHFLQSPASPVAGSAPLRTALTIAGLALPAAISFVVFLLLYRYVPNVRHRARDVVGGALLATVLFEAVKQGFAWYVARFNNYQALYGAIGGVMLFMLWTYLAAMILLLGAEYASEAEKSGRRREEINQTPLSHDEIVGGRARA